MGKREPKTRDAGATLPAKRGETLPAVVEVDEDDDASSSGDDASETDAAEAEALGDVAPASDEELDAIEASLGRRPSAAPAGTTALALRDPMAAYMGEVRRHPLLTREEEHALAVRWVEDGDQDAAKRLVTSNLRLVVKIANEYRRGYQNLLDLVQEGNIGLIKAVQKFDPYRGVKLSTYAGWWIRAYVLKHILNNWRLVKIGTTQNQRKLFFNLRKQREALVRAGVDPTAENIAKGLDVSTEEVVEMQKRMGAPDASLNAPLGSDDEAGARTRMDVLEDEDADPEGEVSSQQFKRMLADKLRVFGATLEGREAEIFTDRLVSDEPVTLQELGDRWGVSRERARQIEKRMVLRLRAYLQEELGDAVQIALGHD
ncbi:RNA polymerase factor sigma-32 [Pseudenhygromyxa sp. WMMC2535]|uniref:RNA polymerase factor sigma-32 n=1 Tax=Pseudenhygromyxa sp. WMMC2535 TaxID=2712867 RepID=UPI0015582801|nr:RNA polymerase factor sigma-32 [Pseudenhygromyxa sp. WMMC2535]NVB38291.1 RNA polymerase factor sigma-32 [Pseudenhygromyxa sp. WMMC2535]